VFLTLCRKDRKKDNGHVKRSECVRKLQENWTEWDSIIHLESVTEHRCPESGTNKERDEVRGVTSG
jgi:hypothetical protein